MRWIKFLLNTSDWSLVRIEDKKLESSLKGYSDPTFSVYYSPFGNATKVESHGLDGSSRPI